MKPRKKGPWTVLDSRVAYKSPWMEVQADKVIGPDGKKSEYATVKIKPGVCIVPLDDEGYVYLAKEYKYGFGGTVLQAFGGGIEKGQAPLQAAKRELLEEAGLKAAKWTSLGKMDPMTSQLKPAPVYMYLAENLSRHPRDLEGTERIDIIKLPIEKALRFVDQGAITLSSSIIALLKTAILKKAI